MKLKFKKIEIKFSIFLFPNVEKSDTLLPNIVWQSPVEPTDNTLEHYLHSWYTLEEYRKFTKNLQKK